MYIAGDVHAHAHTHTWMIHVKYGKNPLQASGEKSFENVVARCPDQMPAFTKGSPISKRELKLTDQHAVLQAPLLISSCNVHRISSLIKLCF